MNQPKTRQCIYCLGHFSAAQITDDHIIAGSWYPETTPSTVQRWTAPACRSCNNRFSSTEQYVHARLAACIDPTHPAAGMWEKAKRSIDPKRARGRRDKEQRIRQRRAFWKGLRTLARAPAHTLPFSIQNLAKGSRTGLIIDAKKVNGLAEKWGRGIYYKIHGHPVSSNAEIEVIHLPEGAVGEAFGGFWEQRKILDAGPGIQVSYLSTEDSSKRADVYLFRIWDQVEIFVAVDDNIATEPAADEVIGFGPVE